MQVLGRAGAVSTLGFRAARAADSPGNPSPPRLRIGQIGTGHAHAGGKVAVLRQSADFELAGVCEPDEQLRKLAAARKDYQGVRWLTEEQLLNTPGLRAVAVETEVKDLLATAERCVAAGLHVHLDKPAGESLLQLRRLLEQAGRRGLTVQMGYMFRYNAGFELCLQAAREGWLGRVFAVEAVIGKAVGADERKKLLPYRGGAMFELGCHLIDAVVALLGPPTAISTQARSAGGLSDGFPDHQVATLAYPEALVTVRSSLLEVGGNLRRQFVVCGEAGTAELRPLEPPAVRLSLAQARGAYRRGDQEVSVPNRPRYAADFADLARVIRGEKQFSWSMAHDLAVQAAVLQASGLPIE